MAPPNNWRKVRNALAWLPQADRADALVALAHLEAERNDEWKARAELESLVLSIAAKASGPGLSLEQAKVRVLDDVECLRADSERLANVEKRAEGHWAIAEHVAGQRWEKLSDWAKERFMYDAMLAVRFVLGSKP